MLNRSHVHVSAIACNLSWPRKKETAAGSHLDVIGQGSFGTVYVTLSASGGPVVIKKIQVNDETRMSFEDEMACQVKLRNRGGHPNVMPFMKYFVEPAIKQAALLMEAGIMDLSKLQRNLAYRIPAGSAARHAAEIVHGLDYVHGCDVIHRDLKPSNIILCSSPFSNCTLVAKIADFGCSRLQAVRPLQTAGFCTVYYRAPEAFESVECTAVSVGSAAVKPSVCLTMDSEGVDSRRTSRHSRYEVSSDIWSLGCILGELLHCKILFLHQSSSEIGILANIAARIGYPPAEVMQIKGMDERQLKASVQVCNSCIFIFVTHMLRSSYLCIYVFLPPSISQFTTFSMRTLCINY